MSIGIYPSKAFTVMPSWQWSLTPSFSIVGLSKRRGKKSTTTTVSQACQPCASHHATASSVPGCRRSDGGWAGI